MVQGKRFDASKPLYAISPEEDRKFDQAKGIAQSNTEAPTKEKVTARPCVVEITRSMEGEGHYMTMQQQPFFCFSSTGGSGSLVVFVGFGETEGAG